MQHDVKSIITPIKEFQSMHPIKDATIRVQNVETFEEISIHAPYKGCNNKLGVPSLEPLDFNPCTL